MLFLPEQLTDVSLSLLVHVQRTGDDRLALAVSYVSQNTIR
jgi:hypothetical protein